MIIFGGQVHVIKISTNLMQSQQSTSQQAVQCGSGFWSDPKSTLVICPAFRHGHGQARRINWQVSLQA